MNIKTIAKYVDQPLVVRKIYDSSPKILIGASAALGLHDIFIKKHHDRESFFSRLKKNIIVLTIVSGASLIAAQGLKYKGKKLFSGLIDETAKSDIIKNNTKVINEYIKNFAPKDNKLLEIFEKGKNKILNLKEVDYLLKALEKKDGASPVIETLLGKFEDKTSREMFKEIGKLSGLGLVPVAAGVGAGMITDIGKKNAKQKNSDRIKEGAYQFLANIFLCNVGAGAVLFGLEGLKKANLLKKITPAQKFFGMIGGILATGVIGGSFIANYLSKKIIDPLVLKKKTKDLTFHKIYDERTPEGIDMCMHIDDVATAGVLSGLKWIEPVLPVFYLFSGYRAGMGYRNREHHHCHHHRHSALAD